MHQGPERDAVRGLGPARAGRDADPRAGAGGRRRALRGADDVHLIKSVEPRAGLTNGTFVTITEELRGLAPLVAEVQTVETSAMPTEAPTFETEAPTFETEAPTYGTGVPSQQPTVTDTSGIHGVFRLGFRGAATIPLPHDASAHRWRTRSTRSART